MSRKNEESAVLAYYNRLKDKIKGSSIAEVTGGICGFEIDGYEVIIKLQKHTKGKNNGKKTIH